MNEDGTETEKKSDAPKSAWRKRLGLILLFLLTAFLAWLVIEPRILLTTEMTVTDTDIPPEFDGFKIVHLSDIHHGSHVSRDFVKKAVEKTNALGPDLIVISGDYISKNKKYIGPCFDELKGLQSEYGVLSVLGNHDYWTDAELVRAAMKRSRIEDLENRSKWIRKQGAKIKVGGVGDLWESEQDLDSATSDAKESDFVVLLCHNPDYAEEVPPDLVDLMLCGHTHGGQFTFFGLYAPKLPVSTGQKYRSGMVEKQGMKIVVSRGIGMIAPPVRFFCPPQIILITLKSEQ